MDQMSCVSLTGVTTANSQQNSAILTVDFAGEIFRLSPGDELAFGRGSTNDIDIDANPRLHRRFGHLSHRDGIWWLRNNGNRLPLVLRDRGSRSSTTLTSGRETSLTFTRSIVAFEAGATSYELELVLSQARPNRVLDHDPALDDDAMNSMTVDQSQIPLVGDQRLLAVALAENKLRHPHKPTDLPTNKAVAHRFGWAMTTYNRKLDRMCKTYARDGVTGLVGTPGEKASDRRTRLVEHLVNTGTVTVADLDLLEEHQSE